LGGLIYDNTLSWECLIDHIMSKLTLTLLMWRIWWAPNNASKWQMVFNLVFKVLSSVWFAMRSVQCVMSQDTLKMIYASYIHSVITNGIILGGNLPYSIKVFRTHTNKLIIITNSRHRDCLKNENTTLIFSGYIFFIIVHCK